jgi:hypothetical protein
LDSVLIFLVRGFALVAHGVAEFAVGRAIPAVARFHGTGISLTLTANLALASTNLVGTDQLGVVAKVADLLSRITARPTSYGL